VYFGVVGGVSEGSEEISTCGGRFV